MTASAVVRSLVSVSLLCGFVLTASARAEVLVRWDRDQVPSPDSLGVSTLVIPAKNKAAAQRALEQGYSVVLEVDAPALAAFAPPAGRVTGVIVKGTATRAQLSALRLRLKPRGITVRTLEERGKWPHIRSNWVTNENGVLQVSSRTQQPWIENNAALIKIAQVTQPDATPLLTYPWTPITLSEIQEGPALENYLVAIAESGSFGADLVLPLHERFQNDLLLGLPQARAWWTDIRRAIAFYASNLTNRYQAAATIGVVTADPMRWFEVMNLLARHTLPFDLIPQDKFVRGTRSLEARSDGRARCAGRASGRHPDEVRRERRHRRASRRSGQVPVAERHAVREDRDSDYLHGGEGPHRRTPRSARESRCVRAAGASAPGPRRPRAADVERRDGDRRALRSARRSTVRTRCC